jgi:predicted RNA binding protein YcfA (HicA-like mRNA interferase family)
MKLPLLSGREVHVVLQRLGFMEIHRKGSHVKMEHPDGNESYFHTTQRSTDTHCEVHCVTPILTRTVSLSRSVEGKPNKSIHQYRRPALCFRMRQVYRTLDSLPAPGSSGGR